MPAAPDPSSPNTLLLCCIICLTIEVQSLLKCLTIIGLTMGRMKDKDQVCDDVERLSRGVDRSIPVNPRSRPCGGFDPPEVGR